MRAVLILLTLLTVGCVSSHKTYKPPNNAKVVASTKKVKEGVDAVHKKAGEARGQVEDAQKSAEKIQLASVDVQKKLDEIIKVAPPELRPALALVKTDVSAMQTEQTLLFGFLTNAHLRQDELETLIVNLNLHVAELEANQNGYYAEAQGLANDATNEREGKIAVEKQLIQQKILSWLWKIGGGLFVVVLLVLLAVFVAAKLGFKVWFMR